LSGYEFVLECPRYAIAEDCEITTFFFSDGKCRPERRNNGNGRQVSTGVSTTDYYDSVVTNMGSHEAEDFLRLYMAPGMQHCYEGPGPNFFGQFDLSSLGPNTQQLSTNRDPQHNISSALEQWVENGAAPGPIIATKYVNDLDPSQGVKMTRPLCPYPQTAKYKGSGDTNDNANFLCARTNNE
jgi:Tannase and feruloyl esterase